MDKSTRNALIKREIKQFEELSRTLADEYIDKAKEQVRQSWINGNFITTIKTEIDKYNSQVKEEMSMAEYVNILFETFKVIDSHIEKAKDEVNTIPDMLFTTYQNIFEEKEEEEFGFSVDLVVQRLDGIATVPQLKREFIKATERVDIHIINKVNRYSEEIIEDINIKINELTGGFLFEFFEVFDNVEFIEKNSDVSKVNKILDRKELQRFARMNGYEFKSQCGSHRKYENENGEVVIIPIHSNDIGKGLSTKIQKNILR